MSKISTVYDYYVSQVASLFPSKTRIANPYSLEDNSSQFLRDGYGIRLGASNLANVDMKTIYHGYDFIVTFCAEVVRMEHDETAFDSVVKQLNEDVFTLRKDFYDIDNNNVNIDQINLASTDPVGFFVAGKNNFLFIETSITTNISEIY